MIIINLINVLSKRNVVVKQYLKIPICDCMRNVLN